MRQAFSWDVSSDFGSIMVGKVTLPLHIVPIPFHSALGRSTLIGVNPSYRQWEFQDPKMEVPTIYKAYVSEYHHKIQYGLIWYSTSILGSWNSHWYRLKQTSCFLRSKSPANQSGLSPFFPFSFVGKLTMVIRGPQVRTVSLRSLQYQPARNSSQQGYQWGETPDEILLIWCFLYLHVKISANISKVRSLKILDCPYCYFLQFRMCLLTKEGNLFVHIKWI